MKKGYDEVIELEDLNALLNSSGSELVTVILYYIVDGLNKRGDLSRSYRFEVISYGFLGKYPAIGVEYLTKENLSVEPVVKEFSNHLLSSISIKDIVLFAKENNSVIQNLIGKLRKDNESNSTWVWHE